MDSFEIGSIYMRKEIHNRFGGQRQGGISTPARHPMILLFTGASGEEHGYKDGWQTDDLFWYYGEGQIGDMEFTRGNKAIASHSETQRSLHLFEKVGRGGGVRYMGEFYCEGNHESLDPDSKGNTRKAIVFELRHM